MVAVWSKDSTLSACWCPIYRRNVYGLCLLGDGNPRPPPPPPISSLFLFTCQVFPHPTQRLPGCLSRGRSSCLCFVHVLAPHGRGLFTTTTPPRPATPTFFLVVSLLFSLTKSAGCLCRPDRGARTTPNSSYQPAVLSRGSRCLACVLVP